MEWNSGGWCVLVYAICDVDVYNCLFVQPNVYSPTEMRQLYICEKKSSTQFRKANVFSYKSKNSWKMYQILSGVYWLDTTPELGSRSTRTSTHPVIYRIPYSVYVVTTSLSARTRLSEHKPSYRIGQFDKSAIAEHTSSGIILHTS